MAFEWINDIEDHKKITTACHCLTILAENLNWQKTILNLKIFSPAMTMTVAAMGKKSCFEEKFISLEPEIFWVEFFSILSAKNIQRSYLGLWGSAYHLLPLKKSLQMAGNKIPKHQIHFFQTILLFQKKFYHYFFILDQLFYLLTIYVY